MYVLIQQKHTIYKCWNLFLYFMIYFKIIIVMITNTIKYQELY